MIFPFNLTEKSLKPATYGVAFLGKCVYFNDEGKKEVEMIADDKEFILRQNSIAFLTLLPRFRIPNYIALRFNLKITNIYKGLLVGTGPLVDPGYDGSLHIPLHNYTTIDRKFIGGKDIVYFEFTKLSPNDIWIKEIKEKPIRYGVYNPFPKYKNKRGDVEDYLAISSPNEPVQSSIYELRKTVDKAVTTVNRLKYFGLSTLVAIFITILVGVGTMIWQGFDLVESTKVFIREEQARQLIIENDFKKEIIALKNRIDSLTVTNEQIKKEDKTLNNENTKN